MPTQIAKPGQTKAGSAPVNSQVRLTLSSQANLAHLIFVFRGVLNPETFEVNRERYADSSLFSPETRRGCLHESRKTSEPGFPSPASDCFRSSLCLFATPPCDFFHPLTLTRHLPIPDPYSFAA